MMRNTSLGKVDDNTAMIFTELFNPEMVQKFINSDDFKEIETNLKFHMKFIKLKKLLKLVYVSY